MGMGWFWPVLTLLAHGSAVVDARPLERVPLLDQKVEGAPRVSVVKAARIVFAPGQPTGRHLHPVPVVGVVTKGSFVFQPRGKASRRLRKGDAFFEPAGVIIERFDNVSSDETAEIDAFYLADGSKAPLIRLLK